ncbi:hypothetical protein [Pseudomonas nitroreducens]|uniref:hypothetical protein n=1 Tax=Pseudomonas nitroreducens TaxID=46680 RepID=UPI003D2921DD
MSSSVVFVQVCEAWSTTGEGLQVCNQITWQPTYLLPPEASGYVDILVNGGFSREAFAIGVAGVLGSFVAGLLTGWVASILRKAK